MKYAIMSGVSYKCGSMKDGYVPFTKDINCVIIDIAEGRAEITDSMVFPLVKSWPGTLSQYANTIDFDDFWSGVTESCDMVLVEYDESAGMADGGRFGYALSWALETWCVPQKDFRHLRIMFRYHGIRWSKKMDYNRPKSSTATLDGLIDFINDNKEQLINLNTAFIREKEAQKVNGI